MKSLIRWSTTLGLVGSTLLGSWFGGNFKALALPEPDVLQTLLRVPVFAVANEQGSPLVASGDNGASIARVFISKQDADAFIEILKEKQPEVGNQLQVYPRSLAEIYNFNRVNAEQEESLRFIYIPTQQQFQEAQKLQGNNFQGVPLFVARAGAAGEEENRQYLIINQNDQQIIPLFFEQEGLQNLLAKFKESNPQQADQVTIEAVSLETVIDTLRTSDNEDLRKLVLVPPQASMEYLPSILEKLRESQNSEQ